MQLDLNSLLEEIRTWKNIVKKKDEKTENLLIQIKECKEHIESIDSSNGTLLQEIARLNSIITALYKSLSVVEKTEADNKALVEEIEKLKYKCKEQEKLYLSQIDELKKDIKKLEADSKREIEKKIAEIEGNISAELEKCAMDIREKENCILMLKDDNSKIKHEKDQEILKIQIEYEEKLGRMKSKYSKHKGVHHHDFKSNDFFRQKYMEKEKEAKEESMKLKKEIDDLKKEIESLKFNNILSATNQQHDLLQNEQFHTTNEMDDFYEECPPNKRTKIIEISPQNSKTNASCSTGNPQNDFTMCNFTDTSLRKQHSAATPFKKKLFNLDMNYFNK